MKGKMKVVQFIHGLNTGGAETLVKEYVLWLKQLYNLEITVLCLERLGSPYECILEKAGIQVIYACKDIDKRENVNFLRRIIKRLLLIRNVKINLHRLNPDVVHVHLPLNSYIKHAKLSQNTYIVYTQHFQVDRWKVKFPKDIKNMKWIIKHYRTQIIAINKEMKNEINKIFAISNTVVLNNGVNVEKFQKGKSQNIIRKELGILQEDFVVGHVGRFNDIKNQSFLLDVFSEICKDKSSAILLLIGNGETEKEIIEKAGRLGIKSKIIILHNRTDVYDLLHAMDIMVFPSKSEGLGIAVVEAQIAGVKCVASSVVPIDTKISNYIKYISLQEDAKTWAQKVLQFSVIERPIEYCGIENWDISFIIKKLYSIYNNYKIVNKENCIEGKY